MEGEGGRRTEDRRIGGGEGGGHGGTRGMREDRGWKRRQEVDDTCMMKR